MSESRVDLSTCDREPIHIPGQIQSHGFLIVLDQKYEVSHCSENVSDFLGISASALLSLPLYEVEQIIGAGHYPRGFITDLISLGKINKSFEQLNPLKIDISGISYYLIISTSFDHYLLEFELVLSGLESDIQKLMGHSISKMLADKNFQSLLENTATQVKTTINYDRVMIYRFAEDGHGEVIAEAKNEGLEPWLGLHYPASDIPKQAREMYKKSLTRIIADVNSIPSKIAAATNNMLPLDLTQSQLRAVSPVHIQYLKNMGVASSFSISILHKDKLWGLIACHNYTPRFIDYRSRESSKLLGQILSSALEFRQEEIHQHTQEAFKNNLDVLTKQLQENGTIEEALTKHQTTILDITEASGAVLVYEKSIVKQGITPDDNQLAMLINWLNENINKPIYHCTNLSAIYPEASEYAAIASGLLVAVISREHGEYVIFFKAEQLQSITWAGNPDKPVLIDEGGLMQISPRNSFEKWSQTVTATSANWGAEEISATLRLKEEIIYAINQKARAVKLMNERLQEAYDELDTFSYTISHDLKNPIAAIKSYAQLLARGLNFEGTEKQILGRIEERANQMDLMINAVLDYSRIGRSEFEYIKIDMDSLLKDIINDLDLVYGVSNVTIAIGQTPDLRGDPTMMLQVFSNLIGNAVKYSRHLENPSVHIEGTVNDTHVCYTVKDNGLGIPAGDLPHVFDLFSRMDNVKSIEGSGVGLSIVKRIVEKHKGNIWVESKLNAGSVFYIRFNN